MQNQTILLTIKSFKYLIEKIKEVLIFPPQLLKLSLSLYKHKEKDEGDYISMKFKTSSIRCGILLPKLFWPSERKKCSSDRVKTLRSLEQFIQTVKVQNNFW